MSKIKYSLAISVDGFIAQEDGSFDCFLMEGEHVVDFFNSFSAYEAVLMGRKTYEVGLAAGQTSYPNMKNYVFSRTMHASADPNVQVVADNVSEVVKGLKAECQKDIWLCGGGSLAATLLAGNLVDEVVLKVNPLLLGLGIPLTGVLPDYIKLDLMNHKHYENGVMLLQYAVCPLC